MIIVCVSAKAEDAFLSDYNLYAKNLYNISEISEMFRSDQYSAYKSDTIELYANSDGIEIYGKNPLDTISSACCALRVIDNPESMIDHYGKVMLAYFLHSTSGKESRATTDSGILIFFNESSGIYSIKLVK